MDDMKRVYPAFAACGLNCGLCPRYYTDGASRCPGCAGEGFSAKHPTCGVLSCCRRQAIDGCYACGEFPCRRYDSVGERDSFISHRNQYTDLERIKEIGVEVYRAELDEKMAALQALLSGYDDGKRKSLFCTAVNLLAPDNIRNVLERLAACTNHSQTQKEKAAQAAQFLQAEADSCGIDLRLRKK